MFVLAVHFYEIMLGLGQHCYACSYTLLPSKVSPATIPNPPNTHPGVLAQMMATK